MLQMENNHVSSNLAHFPVVAGIFLPISRFVKALPKLVLNSSMRTSRGLWAAAPPSIWCTRLEKSKLAILSCSLYVCYHLILPSTMFHWVLEFSVQVTGLLWVFLHFTNKLLFCTTAQNLIFRSHSSWPFSFNFGLQKKKYFPAKLVMQIIQLALTHTS